MNPVWDQFLKQLENYDILLSLSPEKLVEFSQFFRYCTPDTVSTVIVTNKASLTSFGNLNNKILKNMYHYKHLTLPSNKKKYEYNIPGILVQGVLLLNGDDKFHKNWDLFIREFVQAFSKYRKDMEMTVQINMIKDDVPECDIFGMCNKALDGDGRIPIRWNVNQKIFAFTDGGCCGNGKDTAIASFAAYMMTGSIAQIEVSGMVQPQAYRFIDDTNPSRGFTVDDSGGYKFLKPTNNRAEYLAWCWALLTLVRSKTTAPVEVISDCNLFIQTMLDWLPKRKRKGTEHELKNYDLVHIADVLMSQFKDIKLTHVRSHNKNPPAPSASMKYMAYLGNDIVDVRASELMKFYKKASAIPARACAFIQMKKKNKSINFAECDNMSYGIFDKYN
jgi:ribonuclease HI